MARCLRLERAIACVVAAFHEAGLRVLEVCPAWRHELTPDLLAIAAPGWRRDNHGAELAPAMEATEPAMA